LPLPRTQYLGDLTYWIRQRELIRTRKELSRLPPPWVSDPIIANNRWCNIRREDDKVTKWIWAWAGVGYRIDMVHIQHALTVARMVNWPDTLALLGYPADGWTPEYRQHFLDVFAGLRDKKIKGWTGAYMVTGGYSKGGEPKEVIIARVLDGAWQSPRVVHGDSLHTAAGKISTSGIGQFLSAQIVADLKWTPILKDAPDWKTWCAPGPGSMMGLNFLYERKRTTTIPIEQFQAEVGEVKDFIFKTTDIILDAQNTQNCLCELSKFIRAKHFHERLKNTYHAVRTPA
jgi:hypothetical protein